MMKAGTVGGVYFRLIWCQLTRVDLEEGLIRCPLTRVDLELIWCQLTWVDLEEGLRSVRSSFEAYKSPAARPECAGKSRYLSVSIHLSTLIHCITAKPPLATH